MAKHKRVVIVSDFHCGHEVGLTPPQWNPDNEFDKLQPYRERHWSLYAEALKGLQPIDVLVANGDLIDGRGEKSGSLELIVLARDIQAQMAVKAINEAKAKQVYITRGTDYHVGPQESWEDNVAERIENLARIGDVINLDVNGLMFNFRHHIGTSQTPIGRSTPLIREAVWNALWHVRHDFPLAHVIVRSHVHYHTYAGGPGWLALTTPALQGFGTRYGERRLSGIIDWGITYFDVVSKEDFYWDTMTFPYSTPDTSIA